MKLRTPLEGTHIAVPIEGVSSIPVCPETGEVKIPSHLSEQKVEEIETYLAAIYPDALLD